MKFKYENLLRKIYIMFYLVLDSTPIFWLFFLTTILIHIIPTVWSLRLLVFILRDHKRCEQSPLNNVPQAELRLKNHNMCTQHAHQTTGQHTPHSPQHTTTHTQYNVQPYKTNTHSTQLLFYSLANPPINTHKKETGNVMLSKKVDCVSYCWRSDPYCWTSRNHEMTDPIPNSKWK
jgi:hypothetical protein